MRYTDFLDIFPIWGQSSQHRVRAFTMVELLLMVALIGTLSAIAVPTYTNYINQQRNSAAIADIREVELGIVRFQAENGVPPNTLAQAGIPTKLDPWGNPYQYLRLQFAGINPQTIPGHRKDRNLNPLNTDFDLYSMGQDGRSAPALTGAGSNDDIVRANNGAYIGLASDY